MGDWVRVPTDNLQHKNLETQGTIHFPEYINECAAYIGKLRDLYNYNLNQENQKYKRGNQSEYVNILGVKGELIFSHFLHRMGVEHTMSKLLSCSPIPGPDIVVDGKNIDVKTVRTDSTRLLVNQEAHEKNKGIDSYVFIQIKTVNTADFWVYSHVVVSKWTVIDAGFSNAYFKSLVDG